MISRNRIFSCVIMKGMVFMVVWCIGMFDIFEVMDKVMFMGGVISLMV